MLPPDLAERITRRGDRAGVKVPAPLSAQLVTYVKLLAQWNRTINLTALDVELATDEAIDRLIIEPIVAARRVLPGDRLAVDVGSGGGSPAVPLKLAAPGLRLVMIESRTRKAAFLREVIRQLGLTDVEVENERFETLTARADLRGAADLVTVRAVRADRRLWESLHGLLKPGGRVFWFTGAEGKAGPEAPFAEATVEPLGGRGAGRLVTMRRSL